MTEDRQSKGITKGEHLYQTKHRHRHQRRHAEHMESDDDERSKKRGGRRPRSQSSSSSQKERERRRHRKEERASKKLRHRERSSESDEIYRKKKRNRRNKKKDPDDDNDKKFKREWSHRADDEIEQRRRPRRPSPSSSSSYYVRQSRRRRRRNVSYDSSPTSSGGHKYSQDRISGRHTHYPTTRKNQRRSPSPSHSHSNRYGEQYRRDRRARRDRHSRPDEEHPVVYRLVEDGRDRYSSGEQKFTSKQVDRPSSSRDEGLPGKSYHSPPKSLTRQPEAEYRGRVGSPRNDDVKPIPPPEWNRHSYTTSEGETTGVIKNPQAFFNEEKKHVGQKRRAPEIQFSVCHKLPKGDFQLYVCGDCPELGGSTAPEKVKRSGIPLEATDSRDHYESHFVTITSKEPGDTISYLYYIANPKSGMVRDVENLAANDKRARRGCRRITIPSPKRPFSEDERQFCVSDRRWGDLAKPAEIILAKIVHGSFNEVDI